MNKLYCGETGNIKDKFSKCINFFIRNLYGIEAVGEEDFSVMYSFGLQIPCYRKYLFN